MIAAGNVTRSSMNVANVSRHPPSTIWSSIFCSIRFEASFAISRSSTSIFVLICWTSSYASSRLRAAPVAASICIAFWLASPNTASRRSGWMSGIGVGSIPHGFSSLAPINVSRNQDDAARHLFEVIIMKISDPPCAWMSASMSGSYSPRRCRRFFSRRCSTVCIFAVRAASQHFRT